MKAVVKVLGYVKLISLLDSKVLPYVAEWDEEVYWVINENDEVEYQNKTFIAEVVKF